jgi:DMSO/TMAO reductase YedYZ molybdopterin-dependent catalytic subunit
MRRERMMSRKVPLLYLLLVGVLLLGVGPAFVVLAATDDEVPQIEIQDYQGEILGSVTDFRENSIHGVQKIDADAYMLTIDGLVAQSAGFSYGDLQSMSHVRRLITLHCVEGWSVKALWEGIPLAALFDLVHPLPGSTTVIFHAADGYTTSLPLSEILDKDLIIADHINGIVLPPANGFPFQLVAQDKWGYKWIRWITRIELSNDDDFRGYWESIGYSNTGNYGEPMFGR